MNQVTKEVYEALLDPDIIAKSDDGIILIPITNKGEKAIIKACLVNNWYKTYSGKYWFTITTFETLKAAIDARILDLRV